MSSTTARIDDPTQDTPSDNVDAVQVQQEIQRLAATQQNDELYNDEDEDEDDEYLQQYELDSEEEDAYLAELGVEDLNIEDEDWEVADGGRSLATIPTHPTRSVVARADSHQ
jgi:hypothetical protein